MKTDIPSPEGLAELSFNLRYNYVVTREIVRNGARVKLTIYANGEPIGQRATAFPHLYAYVCTLAQADEICSLHQHIQWQMKEAELADKIQLGDPAALAEDERTSGPQYGNRATYLACREKAIKEGKFAGMAKHHREIAAIYQGKLDPLLSGPLEEYNRPFVFCWHQFGRGFVEVPSGVKLVDVLEIPTGLP